MQRTIPILALVLCFSTFVGCGMTPEERMAVLEEQIEIARGVSTQLQEQVDGYDGVLQDLQVQLADESNKAFPEAVEKLQKYIDDAIEGKASVLASKALVDEKLAKAETRLKDLKDAGPISLGHELEFWGETAKDVSGAVPGYGWIGYLVGTLAVAVGGVLKKRADTTSDALRDVVKTVENAKSAFKDTPEVLTEIKAALKQQRPETQLLVQKTKQSL